jgi:hypothetical protein
VLVARNYQPDNLVRLLPAHARASARPEEISRLGETRGRDDSWAGITPEFTATAEAQRDQALGPANADLNELLYLFACQVEWERCGPECGVGSHFCRAQLACWHAGPCSVLARTFAADAATTSGRHSRGRGTPEQSKHGGKHESSRRARHHRELHGLQSEP